jgi:hypothetical protein
MLGTNPQMALVMVAAMVFVIWRSFSEREMTWKSVLLMPIIMGFMLWQAVSGKVSTVLGAGAGGVASLLATPMAIEVVVICAIGLLKGIFLGSRKQVILQPDGTYTMRAHGALYVVVWIAGFVAEAVMQAVFAAVFGVAGPVWMTTAYMFVYFTARQLTVLVRNPAVVATLARAHHTNNAGRHDGIEADNR